MLDFCAMFYYNGTKHKNQDNLYQKIYIGTNYTNIGNRGVETIQSNQSIGLIIGKLREQNNESQQELADAIGVSRSLVKAWELGERRIKIDDLVCLSAHYHVSSDYLLGLSAAATDRQDVRFVCEYTGLSKETIEKFHKYAHLRNHESGILDVFDSYIGFFYEQLLHKLYLIRGSVEQGEKWIDDLNTPRDTWKDARYSVAVKYMFESLKESLFSYYALCRRVPNKLFDSDRVYDELEKYVAPMDHDHEIDLEEFLENGLE